MPALAIEAGRKAVAESGYEGGRTVVLAPMDYPQLGAYGQVTYTPPLADDAVHLTGGLRYTNDKKVGSLFIVNNATPVSVNGVVGPVPLTSNPPQKATGLPPCQTIR